MRRRERNKKGGRPEKRGTERVETVQQRKKKKQKVSKGEKGDRKRKGAEEEISWARRYPENRGEHVQGRTPSQSTHNLELIQITESIDILSLQMNGFHSHDNLNWTSSD